MRSIAARHLAPRPRATAAACARSRRAPRAASRFSSSVAPASRPRAARRARSSAALRAISVARFASRCTWSAISCTREHAAAEMLDARARGLDQLLRSPAARGRAGTAPASAAARRCVGPTRRRATVASSPTEPLQLAHGREQRGRLDEAALGLLGRVARLAERLPAAPAPPAAPPPGSGRAPRRDGAARGPALRRAAPAAPSDARRSAPSARSSASARAPRAARASCVAHQLQLLDAARRPAAAA